MGTIRPPAWTGFHDSLMSSSLGPPLCQASRIYTKWLPVHTSFHVHVDLCSGPSSLSGFPVVDHMASGMDRLPCIPQWLCHQASHFLGPSLQPPIKPPAQTAFHVYVHPCSGPPAWSGFPVVHHMASGMDRLPRIFQCICYRATRSVGLPFNTQSGLRHSPASTVCKSL